MVCLGAPLPLIGHAGKLILTPGLDVNIVSLTRHRRRRIIRRREVSFDRSVGSPTYIDAIGVPKGDPN